MALSVSPSDLITRIARCIGIYETNRGGDEPAPKESALDTVSGVHASMATIEQATMPYAVDASNLFADLAPNALKEAFRAGLVEIRKDWDEELKKSRRKKPERDHQKGNS